MPSMIPVITIDGPSGSGKGTISQLLAKHLSWHWLDSGALYRVLAYAVLTQQLSLTDEYQLSVLARQLDVRFVAQHAWDTPTILFEGQEISLAIRSEACGQAASQIAALPAVRIALLDRQRAFREDPGLIADGRDMGTVVFPDAKLKIFLDATAEERANRRFRQLERQNMPANYQQILTDLRERDARDRNRPVAPLIPAEDAIVVDTTGMTIDEALAKIIGHVSAVN